MLQVYAHVVYVNEVRCTIKAEKDALLTATICNYKAAARATLNSIAVSLYKCCCCHCRMRFTAHLQRHLSDVLTWWRRHLLLSTSSFIEMLNVTVSYTI